MYVYIIIDVTTLKKYEEFIRAIDCMFGLNDMKGCEGKHSRLCDCVEEETSGILWALELGTYTIIERDFKVLINNCLMSPVMNLRWFEF